MLLIINFSSDAFGPIVNTLPGTPMVDTISDISKSFESGLSYQYNNDRRASIRSFDDSFQSFSRDSQSIPRAMGAQRFTENEGLYPSALDIRRIPYNRNKKVKGIDVIKELSPDSGQGDLSPDDSLNSADKSPFRRSSKQDQELKEDQETYVARAEIEEIFMTILFSRLYFRDGRRRIDMVICYEEGKLTTIVGKLKNFQSIHHQSLTEL